MQACHKVPHSTGFILSKFMDAKASEKSPRILVRSGRNGGSSGLLLVMETEQALERASQSIFRKHVSSRQFHSGGLPEDNVDDYPEEAIDPLGLGFQALQEVARRVVLVIGETIHDVQEFLEDVGKELLGPHDDGDQSLAVGVVVPPGDTQGTSGPFQFQQAYFYNKDELKAHLEQKELISQLNKALQAMALDDLEEDEADMFYHGGDGQRVKEEHWAFEQPDVPTFNLQALPRSSDWVKADPLESMNKARLAFDVDTAFSLMRR